MTPDLKLLIWTVALTFVQAMIAVLGASGRVGLAMLAGNREDLPAITGWAGRARRAHWNMLENLPLFIALVLAAHISNRGNGVTLLGEELFLWARLAHAIIYIVGIPWARTLAYIVSVIGLFLIFSQLL